jgi:2,4-dienoyl-CoA reductase-like NADH-dependent reductase (Old Yellow Enzyme family)/pyruvate/2-oxoglutarate dehydrogenase complex dihydrolipoamide dehydrogenase (E3) component
MANFGLIFSPFTVGGLRLKNRILMAAMGNNFSHPQGTVSDRAIAYYRERAKGGTGLIITEATPVSLSGRHRGRGLCAYDDSFLPGLRRLAASVHDHGSAIALQLHHAGRLADPDITGSPPLAPSPIPRAPGAPVPKELSQDEIQEIIIQFGQAARRAKEAGFDAVEIHGAHGYLIYQFLSPRTNKREDFYGGNPENRVRFALEVLRRVRKEVGNSFPVLFRLSAREFSENGYSLEESLDWAIELERAGASALHVSGGTTESLTGSAQVIPPMVFPEAYHVPLAAAIKKKVRIPVIAVGRLGTPAVAERVLDEGQADLIAAGRAFLCDPYWPLKAARGEKDRIRPCVACNHCLWRLFQQEELTCFQNALLGNEEKYRMDPVEKVKKVLIIGGGPGGLEAGRVARKRGHQVTLLEKSPRLGGQMLLASIPPHKQTLSKAMDWLTREVDREGVEIKLNTEGNEENIAKENPDVVIVATGARPIFPDSFSGPKVLTAWEVLAGKEVEKEVLILGGGMVGMETAEFLSQKGCRVIVVEMTERLAADMEGTTRALLLERIALQKISSLLSTEVKDIRDGKVLVSHDGNERWLEAGTIILALGSRANNEILQAWEGKVPQILPIGDCVEPRKAKEAIHEGFAAALQV